MGKGGQTGYVGIWECQRYKRRYAVARYGSRYSVRELEGSIVELIVSNKGAVVMWFAIPNDGRTRERITGFAKRLLTGDRETIKSV